MHSLVLLQEIQWFQMMRGHLCDIYKFIVFFYAIVRSGLEVPTYLNICSKSTSMYMFMSILQVFYTTCICNSILSIS